MTRYSLREDEPTEDDAAEGRPKDALTTMAGSITSASSVSGYSMRSDSTNGSDARLLSLATKQATVAATSILTTGGGDTVALDTARAAAKAILMAPHAALRGPKALLARRKAVKQSEVVASMALVSASYALGKHGGDLQTFENMQVMYGNEGASSSISSLVGGGVSTASSRHTFQRDAAMRKKAMSNHRSSSSSAASYRPNAIVSNSKTPKTRNVRHIVDTIQEEVEEKPSHANSSTTGSTASEFNVYKKVAIHVESNSKSRSESYSPPLLEPPPPINTLSPRAMHSPRSALTLKSLSLRSASLRSGSLRSALSPRSGQSFSRSGFSPQSSSTRHKDGKYSKAIKNGSFEDYRTRNLSDGVEDEDPIYTLPEHIDSSSNSSRDSAEEEISEGDPRDLLTTSTSSHTMGTDGTGTTGGTRSSEEGGDYDDDTVDGTYASWFAHLPNFQCFGSSNQMECSDQPKSPSSYIKHGCFESNPVRHNRSIESTASENTESFTEELDQVMSSEEEVTTDDSYELFESNKMRARSVQKFVLSSSDEEGYDQGYDDSEEPLPHSSSSLKISLRKKMSRIIGRNGSSKHQPRARPSPKYPKARAPPLANKENESPPPSFAPRRSRGRTRHRHVEVPVYSSSSASTAGRFDYVDSSSLDIAASTSSGFDRSTLTALRRKKKQEKKHASKRFGWRKFAKRRDHPAHEDAVFA